MEVGRDPPAPGLGRQVADRRDRVVAGLEPDVLDQAAVVHPAPVAQQANAVAEQPAGTEPARKALHRRREQRMRDRQRRPSAEPEDAAERDRTARGDVDGASHRLADGRLERGGRVVGVEELQPGIEAELDRDDRKGQVANQRRVEVGADLGLVAQHAADEVRAAPREVLEVLLELRDVALKPRPQRSRTREVLREEVGRRTLTAVDRRRAADDHMPHRLGPLAGGEQLQRADDVDLVKGGRRGAGLRVPEDPAVDDGLDPGGRQQAREHRVRMSASMNSVRPRAAGGGRLSIPRMWSTPGSRSSRWASAAPQKLETPMIATRRPAAPI